MTPAHDDRPVALIEIHLLGDSILITQSRVITDAVLKLAIITALLDMLTGGVDHGR